MGSWDSELSEAVDMRCNLDITEPAMGRRRYVNCDLVNRRPLGLEDSSQKLEVVS